MVLHSSAECSYDQTGHVFYSFKIGAGVMPVDAVDISTKAQLEFGRFGAPSFLVGGAHKRGELGRAVNVTPILAPQ